MAETEAEDVLRASMEVVVVVLAVVACGHNKHKRTHALDELKCRSGRHLLLLRCLPLLSLSAGVPRRKSEETC